MKSDAGVQVNGRRAWYGTGGTAWRVGQPLLVFVHGAGQDHTVWSLQARSFGRQGWNTAAVDLPGHGRTEDDPKLESIEAYASWLAGFIGEIAQTAEQPVVVAGHSMGSCVAVNFAAARPEALVGLALLGAGESTPVNQRLLDDTLARPERAHRFITAFGHGRNAHFGGAENPGLWNIGATIALLERAAPEVLHRDFNACNDWAGGVVAGEIRCPTMVISAAADRMTPPRAGQSLAEAIVGARFEVLPGAGHMMMAEAPDAVTRTLAGFLASLTLERMVDQGRQPGAEQ